MTKENRVASTLNGEKYFQYVIQFEDDFGGGLGKLMNYGWDIVSIFVDFLKLFYEIKYRFFCSLYVTSNNVCQHIYEIKKYLDEICHSESPLLEVWQVL